MLINIPYQQG